MSESWDDLKTREDWAGRLRELLDEASAASDADDDARRTRRRAVKRGLIDFIDHSPNGMAGMSTLDGIADKAILDLTKGSLAECITGIESRTVELVRYMKEIRSVAGELERDARSIRGEHVMRISESATGLITKIRELYDSLKNSSGDKEFGKKLEEAILTIQGVRSTIEQVSGTR